MTGRGQLPSRHILIKAEIAEKHATKVHHILDIKLTAKVGGAEGKGRCERLLLLFLLVSV